MIHGGLRYLEKGEFALAKESRAEPGALPMKIGLTLYAPVTRGRRALPPHQVRNGRATGQNWSASYHDAWISYPERLGLELVVDTAGMAPRDDDARSGAPMVSGTQRSHLILDNPALRAALGGHMVFFENSDGRVCIMFSYLGKVLAGFTDTRVEIPTRTASTEPERRYMLEAVGRLFPGLPFAEEDTVFSYSGIRPLPQSNHAFTGRISRGHCPTGSTARCRRSAWSGASARPSAPLPSRRPPSCSPNSDACVRRALGPCRSAVGAIFPAAPHFGKR